MGVRGGGSAPPFLNRLEHPLASVKAFAKQLADAGLGFDGFEMAVECFDFAGKAAAFIALNYPDDFGEFGLIPLLPRRLAGGAPLFPVVHVEPLNVADAHRRLHLLLALDKYGLDVAALHSYGDGDFIAAHAGVAGGIFREEGQDAVALQNAVGDRVPPFVAELDLVLVEPDIVSALLQVGLDAADQLLVAVVAIAEEDAQWLMGTRSGHGKEYAQASRTGEAHLSLVTEPRDQKCRAATAGDFSSTSPERRSPDYCATRIST